MNRLTHTVLQGKVIEADTLFTLNELSAASGASISHLITWVWEGILRPTGEEPHWQFSGPALRHARLALTLTRDLDLNPPGVALAIELLEQIGYLKNYIVCHHANYIEHVR